MVTVLVLRALQTQRDRVMAVIAISRIDVPAPPLALTDGTGVDGVQSAASVWIGLFQAQLVTSLGADTLRRIESQQATVYLTH